MLDLNAFAREVHANAISKGWWEEERSFGEIIALCHSELSEALEEYRAGRPMVYCDADCKCKGDSHACIDVCGSRAGTAKPEGIAVELADCIIRILDWCGKDGVDIGERVEFASRLLANVQKDRFGDDIAALHGLLSNAYASDRTRMYNMAGVIACIYKWSELNGIDMDAILRLKHEYNKGRSYRHGGKVI